MEFKYTNLEEAFIVKDGTHDSPKYVNKEEGFALITSKNLKSGILDFEQVDYISKADFEKINQRSKVDKGDLLFAMIGTIGNPVIVDIEPFFAIKNVALIKPSTSQNSLEYLRIVLRLDETKKKLIQETKGGTQQFVSLGNLRKFKIPLPSLDEQHRIATILNKIEALITKRKTSILLLDEFLKSSFWKLFGDPIRNEKGWSKDFLENIVAKDCPLTYGIVQPGEDFPNGTPIIRPVDLFKSHITLEGLKLIDPKISQKYKRTILKGNEILMCVRGTTGVVSYATDELKGCNVTRGITPIWFDENYEKLFAYFLFQSAPIQKEIAKYTYGSTLQQINLSDLRKLNLIIPPIELQKQFVTITEKSMLLRNQFDNSLQKLDNLYLSLSQKIFNGKLNLSNVEIDEKYLGNQRQAEEVLMKEWDERMKYQQQRDERKKKEKEKLKIKPIDISKPKITWDKVSSQQVAEWIKEKYEGHYFSNEMLIRFLKEEHVVFPDYYSSEELKKYPQLNGADDIKSFIFSAVSNENPFIKLEQHFYNAEKETFQLNVTEEDYELIESREAKERSGIYFSIVKQ